MTLLIPLMYQQSCFGRPVLSEVFISNMVLMLLKLSFCVKYIFFVLILNSLSAHIHYINAMK